MGRIRDGIVGVYADLEMALMYLGNRYQRFLAQVQRADTRINFTKAYSKLEGHNLNIRTLEFSTTSGLVLLREDLPYTGNQQHHVHSGVKDFTLNIPARR
jgi:hypothetical protein